MGKKTPMYNIAELLPFDPPKDELFSMGLGISINYGNSVEPRWKHDCRHCIFLGFWKEYDFYLCPKHPRLTLIARNGNKPREYMSGLYCLGDEKPLQYAAVAAMSLGLFFFDDIPKEANIQKFILRTVQPWLAHEMLVVADVHDAYPRL
jgi:hypothetical protein